jgi:hypothetical protein
MSDPNGGGIAGTVSIGGNSVTTPMSVGTTTAQPVNFITNNAIRFTLDTTGNVLASSAGAFGWSSRAKITSPADGQVLLTNAAGNSFDTLFFGSATGTTSPMLKVVQDQLYLEVADSSRLTAFNAQAFLQGFLMPRSGGIASPEYTSFTYDQAGMTFTSNATLSFVFNKAEWVRFDATNAGQSELLLHQDMRLLWGTSGMDTATLGIMPGPNNGLLFLGDHIFSTKFMTSGEGGSSGYTFESGPQIISDADGVIRFLNNAGTDFGRLEFGGKTNAFPALKRNAAGLQVRLADDSNFAVVQGILQTDANAVAETPTATHTLTLRDASGTAYKVLALAA